MPVVLDPEEKPGVPASSEGNAKPDNDSEGPTEECASLINDISKSESNNKPPPLEQGYAQLKSSKLPHDLFEVESDSESYDSADYITASESDSPGCNDNESSESSVEFSDDDDAEEVDGGGSSGNVVSGASTESSLSDLSAFLGSTGAHEQNSSEFSIGNYPSSSECQPLVYSNNAATISESDTTSEEEGLEELELMYTNFMNVRKKVESKNRKNVMMTVEGQTEIISNWAPESFPSSGPSVLFVNPKPFVRAAELHNTNFSRSLISNDTISVINTIREGYRRSADQKTNDNNCSSPGVHDETCEAGPSGQQSSTGDRDHPAPEDRKKKLPSCKKCNLYFTSKYYWYSHVIKVHGNAERQAERDELYECPECHKQFGQKRNRHLHMMTHNFPEK